MPQQHSDERYRPYRAVYGKCPLGMVSIEVRVRADMVILHIESILQERNNDSAERRSLPEQNTGLCRIVCADNHTRPQSADAQAVGQVAEEIAHRACDLTGIQAVLRQRKTELSARFLFVFPPFFYSIFCILNRSR